MKTHQAGPPVRDFQLTVGPVQYHWSRSELLSFYARVAESSVDSIVLGEVVCSRRHEMKTPDWLALARDLRATGKEVIIATQVLIESEADVRVLRRIAEEPEFIVEAGDASALNVLVEMKASFILGPHINVYSKPALREYVRLGAVRWVAPVELSLAAVAGVHADERTLPTEVFAYGRLPLAFSARCFTARHHRLSKDQCEFRCRDDDDGLLLSTADGRPFLVLNGIQTQSAGLQCLITERTELLAAGVSRLRLSPTSQHFIEAVEAFERVMNRGGNADEALLALNALAPPGGLVNGFAAARAGIERVQRP
ncbi:U32 family peptidase [Aquincola sp. S2]|uniref:Ubiquinone biosynthesis protein UbiV n=1 Tax=Pseudaquabacterium terrae TaxID=2732868 RepID=A0ABX2EQS3_9BURK|nr:U32 family peptidase [Aquabacterium terrae]NRF71011.1 U32 family peptidase [Aquabacterium terrae]